MLKVVPKTIYFVNDFPDLLRFRITEFPRTSEKESTSLFLKVCVMDIVDGVPTNNKDSLPRLEFLECIQQVAVAIFDRDKVVCMAIVRHEGRSMEAIFALQEDQRRIQFFELRVHLVYDFLVDVVQFITSSL